MYHSKHLIKNMLTLGKLYTYLLLQLKVPEKDLYLVNGKYGCSVYLTSDADVIDFISTHFNYVCRFILPGI